MRTIAIALAIVAMMTAPVFAGAITDSVQPLGHMKFAATVEDNYIFDKEFEALENRTNFEIKDINQIYGKLAMGLTPYFNVYAKLGASDTGEITDEDTSGNKLKIETKYGFLCGLGVSGAKEITDGWRIGVDGQFNYWKAGADKVTYGTTEKARNIGGDILNFEFQATPFITKKFAIADANWEFNPYVGVPISYFRSETDDKISYTAAGANRTTSWTVKGNHFVGLVFGSDLAFSKNLAIQLEGRLFSEGAISGGMKYKF